VDDIDCLCLIRLFNEPAGKKFLSNRGVSETMIHALPLLGISSVSNLLVSIKFAKYYDLTPRDVILTVFTDSMELYQSRLRELGEARGQYTELEAAKDYHHSLIGARTDHMLELSYQDRLRIHNLKYFTWVEQQGKSVKELNAQWHDYPDYWKDIQSKEGEIDRLITDFNQQTDLI
jgi:cysteine synthase A